MVEILIAVSLLFLALLGVTELIRGIRLRLMRPDEQKRKLLIVYLDGDSAEQQLRYIAEANGWAGVRADYIVALHGELSDEDYHLYERVADETGAVMCPVELTERVVSQLIRGSSDSNDRNR